MAADGNRKERIYVGGLDPSRGLTVELVASRLRSVRDVEILSINDDANKSKRETFDEDGDLVDTRNFFYLEARLTAATKSTEASALDLLAKQYHSVKWKGCQLRVEAAKPHFLKRLEEERALRLIKNESTISQNDTEHEQTSEEKVVKSRRRLRIRKQFGEEAYTVDTRPHPLELSQQDQDGWHDFSTLNKRMHDKRQSQQKKLVERRKDERRLWASGKGNGKKDPATAESDDLRSLIFLNRAIHIRFSEHGVGRKEKVKEVVEIKDTDAEDVESVASSSVVSSDSEESLHQKTYATEERKPNACSDDDNSDGDDTEDDSDTDVTSENHADTNSAKSKTGGKYVWSDDDDDDDDMQDDTSDSQSTSSEDSKQADKELKRNNHKVVKRVVDGSAYTKAVTIDEFSGGMDFDSAPNNFEDDSGGSEDDFGGRFSDDASEHHLEDDIRSNIGILATIFPDAHFERQPLAASTISSESNVGKSTGAGEEGKNPSWSPTFGSGMIMQRYDPTKESDKKFEMPQSDRSTKIGDAEPSVREEMDKGRGSKNKAPGEDTSVLSESSGDKGALSKQTIKSERLKSGQEKKPADEAGDKKTKTVTNTEGKVVPATDVYEQGKLEDIFKQAREGKHAPFSLANLFQGDGNGSKKVESEDNVYEQDKLEDVFKQAKGVGNSNAGADGFAFGFQMQMPNDKNGDGEDTSTPFSFGFDPSNTSKNEKDIVSPQRNPEQISNNCEQKPVDAIHSSPTTKEIEEGSINEPSRTKKIVGMRFLESDLDAHEEVFFSLNEGPQILKDLDATKQDEESQERWQKERLILTADWKRKQKLASSRKGKRARRL